MSQSQKLYELHESNSTILSLLRQRFYYYMVSGIHQSNIVQDGGRQCYDQIPYQYHIAFVVILSVIHIGFIWKWRRELDYFVKQIKSTTFEKRFAICSLLSYLITVLFKLKTRKALFMLNPCHITILIQIYLMYNTNNRINRIIYNAWSGWLFGPYMATLIPHLNGIDQFEVILYYYEHVAIIPLGYLILNKRYGFMKPTIRNNLAAFSTIALYQFFVLVPFSRTNMVNLNFALCHSPADPSYQVVGPFYFVICTLFLNIFSWLVRWASYIQIKMVYRVLNIFGISEPQMMKCKNIGNESMDHSKEKENRSQQQFSISNGESKKKMH